MFYPLVTLELFDRGQSAIAVGIILGLLSGTGQISSALIGRANFHWGSKRLAISGLVLRSAGLMVFALDANTLTYAAGAVVASIGSSSTALAIKTELMRTSISRETITLRSIAINIGALVGPAIGATLYVGASFSIIILVVVFSYASLACVLLAVSFHQPETSERRPSSGYGKNQLSWYLEPSLVLISACVFAYWAIYAQWTLVVPILAAEGFGTPIASAWVFTGNAVLILLLQYPILVKGLVDLRSTRILLLGFASFVGTFAMLVLPKGIATVLAFATLFSFSELLISPTLDEVVGRLRGGSLGLTRAYGMVGTVGGVASVAGATAGGILIEMLGGTGGIFWLGAPMAVLGLWAGLALGRRELLL
ncbi:hypothetical protein LCM19_02185 [Qipengyuania flava]|nr:hypothetical protein [Qipengyuania flava]